MQPPRYCFRTTRMNHEEHEWVAGCEYHTVRGFISESVRLGRHGLSRKFLGLSQPRLSVDFVGYPHATALPQQASRTTGRPSK